MKLSAPVYHLKRQARVMARQRNLPLHQALNLMAAKEGFASWSLLCSKITSAFDAAKIYGELSDGDLLLVAARPGHGKTLLCLELAAEAMKRNKATKLFSLECTEQQIAQSFQMIGVDPGTLNSKFSFDNTNDICADHIIGECADDPRGSLIVIDYLQLLDQNRKHPDLMSQIEKLRSFARDSGVILVFISQIDRAFETSSKSMPDLSDVRLPNPVDLSLFNKSCFLNNGAVQFSGAIPA